ncbi:DUF6879 family protein [Nocardia sp. NPDC056000]|uniref:DUF6879 family protein n=1 Tax=Nocardia sp. NPDC056000 TaxID=3345674 RepID=UPI0035E12255
MELLTDEQWSALYASCTASTLHLELRDVYAVPDEAERISGWRYGTLDEAEDREWWAPWLSMTREMTRRGVDMRRARVVSEPVSEYIHYEWETTRNPEGGEQVRRLPRHRTTTLALSPVDFWLFDDRLVVFNHFDGDGRWFGNEQTRAPDVIVRCRDAFESVWRLGTPHGEYRPALK